MAIRPSELARLTLGKGTANTAIRWLPFFLPTLTLAFNSSTATLALLLGAAEAAGLCTLLVGRWLDRGYERKVMVAALVGIAVSAILAMSGSVAAFAASALLLGACVGLKTVAGHAWISARVAFDRRARFIGIYETSWAAALLIGVPLISVLIGRVGWRGPFTAVAVVATLAAVLVRSIGDRKREVCAADAGALDAAGLEGSHRSSGQEGADDRAAGGPLSVDAWLVIVVSAGTAIAGLTTIAIVGTWLDDALGVSTGGVGLVAMAFGVAELAASMSSAAFADRLGKGRSIFVSLFGVVVGLATIASAGTSLVVGVGGLVVFFLAFEYAIVTSFSLVSEAMPSARGRVIATGSAVSTVARGAGVAAAGFLYDLVGIRGPAGISFGATLVAIAALAVVARRRPGLM